MAPASTAIIAIVDGSPPSGANCGFLRGDVHGGAEGGRTGFADLRETPFQHVAGISTAQSHGGAGSQLSMTLRFA